IDPELSVSIHQTSEGSVGSGRVRLPGRFFDGLFVQKNDLHLGGSKPSGLLALLAKDGGVFNESLQGQELSERPIYTALRREGFQERSRVPCQRTLLSSHDCFLCDGLTRPPSKAPEQKFIRV